MSARPGKSTLQLLSALMLAALLCVQIGAETHVHGAELDAIDCLQCKTDSGNAALPAQPRLLAIVRSTAQTPAAVILAPINSHYRRSARGPPPFSC